MRELQIYGPPGTGKTTRLSTEEIFKAVNLFTGRKILVMSYTRAGAKEIATKKSLKTGRPIDIPKENIGTLHKICFWALGAPKIAEANVDAWNEQYPAMAINGSSINQVDDFGIHEAAGIGDGDAILNKINIMRAKMIDYNSWPHNLKLFWKRWSEFKSDCDYLDFSDLIEKCIEKYPYAPGRPEVIFVDEAQDMTPLQLKLVRQWGMQARYLVLCGDDDQTLYSWLGCSPDAFLKSSYGNTEKRKLEQSFRVPRNVFDKAMEIINKVKIREPKEYRPRDFDGIVRNTLEGTYRFVDNLVRDIAKQIAAGRTTMVLGSCGYMLDPLKKALREEGIAFCNPYKNRGDWNPLRRSDKIITATEFMLNFLQDNAIDGQWSIEQFLGWAKYIKVGESGLIRKTGKAGIAALEKAIEDNAEGLETTQNCINQILTDTAMEQALNRNIDWLVENVQATRRNSLDFPLRVYKKHGINALTETPKCIIGTIHSVKGGESKCVYIFPDLSLQAIRELDRSRDRDSLYRLFYVAVTRASEELVLMQNATKYHADLW